MSDEKSEDDWKNAIVSTLRGASEDGSKSSKLQVKKLRKIVLLSLQIDDADKTTKKKYKKVVQSLEEEGVLKLDSDGMVKLKKSKRKPSKNGDESRSGKKSKHNQQEDDKATSEEQLAEADSQSASTRKIVRSCTGNPQGVTRLFLGNLPFAVDEDSLGEFLPGSVTHIKWITDKETGKFYGSAFCEMDTPENAAAAVKLAGSELMGRPVKINYAPAREGDVWPPPKKVMSGGQAGGSGVKAMSAKPENCVKLFIGNLSYDVDDDTITKFFASVEAELKAVRWLHHRDSGDFKGCGFVEFWNTEACEKAATLNGKNLLGRPIRIDWTD